MNDNKIYLHSESILNMTPRFFIDYIYFKSRRFYEWFKEDLSDSQIEKKVIHDIKDFDLTITTSKDPKIKSLSSRRIKIIFDWKYIIKRIRKYYEETE